MRTIEKPLDMPRNCFLTCINGIDDDDLKNRLNDCLDIISEASDEFTEKIDINSLYTIDRTHSIENVTAIELSSVYEIAMVAQNSAGREIYERLFSAATHNVCPLCNQRQVDTLDHYLPKKKYPKLAVNPYNLVPACWQCNKIKGQHHPSTAENELLHPYFDNIENEIWLNARVVQSNPPTLIYYVSPPDSWSIVMKNRAKFHLERLEIDLLYAVNAAVELDNIKKLLWDRLREGGVEHVKYFLNEQKESREATNFNSWQAVLYRTILNDDWFCNTGITYYQ